MSHIQIKDEQGVRIISIDRPDKLNALSLDMYKQMTEYLIQGESDNGIRAFLLRGQQNCFTSGNDIADFLSNPDMGRNHPAVNFLFTLLTLKKPLIAAVSGSAVGIGTTVLLHCDLVYADDSAQFMLPFVNLGLVPEAGASLLLPQLIGHPHAAELLLLGEPFNAETAKDLKMINRICSASELYGFALKQAKRIAAQPPEAIQQTKQLMRPNQQQVNRQMELEIEQFAKLLHSEQAQARFKAFLNK